MHWPALPSNALHRATRPPDGTNSCAPPAGTLCAVQALYVSRIQELLAEAVDAGRQCQPVVVVPIAVRMSDADRAVRRAPPA
jgi:hypothetical protein